MARIRDRRARGDWRRLGRHTRRAPNLASRITCPRCGAQREETMPTEFCLVVYKCPACGATLKPKRGDCCVFCSFGDVPCPPAQLESRRGARETVACR